MRGGGLVLDKGIGVKKVVGFVLALMRVLGAWISEVLGFRPYFG